MLSTIPDRQHREAAPTPPPVPQRSGRAAVAAGLVCAVVFALAVVGLLNRTTGPATRPGKGIGGVTVAAPPPMAHPACTWTRKLVPTCGRWWGMAPLAHTTTPVQDALPTEERAANRGMDIVHVYKRNGQLFPNDIERSMALDAQNPRLLLINWKPATDTTWRAVAMGAADARIDTEAAYLKTNFRHRFFLNIWHEPENDVNATPGSGYTAADYAAMYRHVVLRLRADGITYAVTVMNYMGFDNWTLKPWFTQLWPGSDVVDWIGLDPYAVGKGVGTATNNFALMVNRPLGSFPGYYTWAQRNFPGKPIMLCEWGVEASTTDPGAQGRFFAGMASAIRAFPNIKALVYFDMPTPPPGQWITYLQSNPTTTRWYRTIGRLAPFVGPRVRYGS